MIGHRFEDGRRWEIAQKCRVTGDQHRAASEILNSQPQFGQLLSVLEGAGCLLCCELNCLGNKKLLHFQRAGLEATL